MPRTPRRSSARVLVAAATVVAVAITAVALISSTAVAAERDDGRRSALAAAVDRSGASDLGSLVTERATSSAVALAVASTPAPPPPVRCPVPGSEFVDSWGFARSGGRGHKGVDMMAPHGTPVLAPVDGTIRSSNSALGGLGFYLEDADGNVYFGSHLATLDVTGPVEAGSRIGTVGSSGNAGTPHLHFEIAPGGGAAVNPFPYVLGWCSQQPDDPWTAPTLP